MERDLLPPQGLCCLAMEAALPSCAEARLAVAKVSQIDNAIRYLLDETHGGQDATIHYKGITTGSRAEGFTLEDGWGLEKADVDSMYIFGGAWTVHIPDDSTETPEEPYLELDVTSCPPAYSRVHVVGNKDILVERMSDKIGRGQLRRVSVFGGAMVLGIVMYLVFSSGSASALTGITGLMVLLSMPPHIRSGYYRREDSYRVLEALRRNMPRVYNVLMIWDIPRDNIHECFQEQESGQYYMSSDKKIISALGDFGHPQNKEGPSQTIDDDDHVPGLLCDRRFANIDEFLDRRRGSWPERDTLGKMARLPGLLVPIGKKTSPSFDIEWRHSYSFHELLLSRDMPYWVKIAYRTVKYTLKSLKDNVVADQKFNLQLPDADIEGRSKISSYHIKTVLMWELENNHGNHNECPFELVQRIFLRLDKCLSKGRLDNYFDRHCNLLERVEKREIAFTKENTKKILNDPLTYILHCPLNPAEVYGETHPDVLSCFLKELHQISEEDWCPKRGKDLLPILRKLDNFRYEKYKVMRDKETKNDIQRAVHAEDRVRPRSLENMFTELMGSNWQVCKDISFLIVVWSTLVWN